YSPYTRALQSVLRSGEIGDIINVVHVEPVGWYHFAHSFVRGNWRNEAETSFSLMTKCCHDVDLLTHLFAPLKAKRVSSFGSLTHFKKSRKPKEAGDAKNCLDCSISSSCPYSATSLYITQARKLNKNWPISVVCGGQEVDAETPQDLEDLVVSKLRDGQYGACVYEIPDNDVCDHQVVNIEFEGGKTASLTMVAFTESVCQRATRIHGTKGEIIGDMSTFTVFDFGSKVKRTVDPAKTDVDGDGTSGHGGGDSGLMHAFIRAVATGDQSLLGCDVNDVFESHRLVFAAEEARLKGTVSLNTSPRNVGIAIGLAVSTVSVLMITSQSKQSRGKKLPIYGLFSALNDMIRYAGKGKQHLLLASIQERQGPYVGIMSPADGLLVLTSDHGLIHKAYTSPDFRRDEFFVPKSKGLLDYALFVLPTGEIWKIHRKWIQPAFGPKQLKWAAQVSQREAAAWLNDFQGGEEVDILNEFTCLTLDIMQSFDAVKSLHSNSSESHETDLHKAMQTIMNTYQERLATPQILWPIYGISNSSRQVKNAREYIDNLMTNILATKRASSPSHQAHEDLLDRLLAPSTDATTPKFTDAEILGETFGFFLAGHETTANTLTFVALELSRNPSVQESLKKEIKHLLTVYPTLTQETLHHFTYLDQVLRETQRLHPIVGIALRTSTAEVEHDGYIFPAGTKVGLHLMAMH
ncbi:hypothetical protein HDU99_002329, partial [Rhizoclosmatium hyalinum]